MYHIVVTPEAQQELERESAYSESRWGKAHAKKYFAQLRRKIKDLSKAPHAHRAHDDILPGLRLLHHKGSVIVYWINEARKQVIILGVPSIYRELSRETLQGRVHKQDMGAIL
ncbi:MAG: type II toxin-antitoxin system RelE/ParE family toxin [Vampirovibrionales bacterium]|nr:type II toxin-antitoxin system RelE/ParE family toxin [Vampirovibrionales bacterium]